MSREDGGQVRVVVRETCPFKLTEPGVRFQIRGDAPESRFGFVWRGGKDRATEKKNAAVNPWCRSSPRTMESFSVEEMTTLC